MLRRSSDMYCILHPSVIYLEDVYIRTVASAPVGAGSERLIGILRIPNKNAEKNI